MASPQPRAPRLKPPRKRSIQACLPCRSRKVRCDVSLHGQPCTNCSLDDKQCLIPEGIAVWNQVDQRAKRRALQQAANSSLVTNSAPKSATTTEHTLVDSMSVSESAGSVEVFDPTAITSAWNPECMDSLDFNAFLRPTPEKPYEFPSLCQQPNVPSWFVNMSENHMGAFLPRGSAPAPLERPLKADKGVVLYSHYRFLTAGNIQAIPHQDVSYLEGQGCLHVPTPQILDVFMLKYFTHVHVFQPLLDEGDFWDMYSHSSQPLAKGTLSLVVLYAMLFASCNFVPVEHLAQLGYSDIRTASAELYRRTKLLYDLEIESTHLPLSQAALLLMSWVPNIPLNTSPDPWKTWHRLALRHADSINAHRYGGEVDVANLDPSQKCYVRSVRRLWWCCIILDRISPLCTRFRLQITRDAFDLNAYVPLGFDDLQTEIHRSRVFAPAIKRRHIILFSKFLDLMMILTDVLCIAFPYDTKVETRPETTQGSDLKVQKCRRLLRSWHESATVDFPLFDGQDQEWHIDTMDPTNSIILYTNLMYIYYYTACITLCNFRVFSQLSKAISSTTHLATKETAAQNNEICRDLECSALGLTKCVRVLANYHLINSLPVSVLACIATPLALQLITARLSSLRRELALGHIDRRPQIDPAVNQSRLNVLIQATDAFSPHYYGVDWVKTTAKHTADLAQAYNQRLRTSDREAIENWGHILLRDPDTYLRLTWTVDLCISKGKLPEDQDFPLCVRNSLDKTRRASHESRDKFDVRQRLDGSSEQSGSELEQLLGMAGTAVESPWDDMVLFGNGFDEAT